MRADYQNALRKIADFDVQNKPTKDQIYERDRQHWNAVESRGGQVETSLCEGAQRALTAFEQQRNRAIDAIIRPVLEADDKQVALDAARGTKAAREFLDIFAALATREDERIEFLRRLGRGEMPTIAAHREPHAAAFIQRAEPRLHPPVPVRDVARPPIAMPTFADLVAS